MTGLKIIGVKIIGLCSHCREEGDEILKYTDGRIVPDEDISCINDAFGSCKAKDEKEMQRLSDGYARALNAKCLELKNQKAEMIKTFTEMIEKLKTSIMKNGNLKHRIIEDEEGEYKHIRDDTLNLIVLDYIDEELLNKLKEIGK